jgi:hypothetical protein
MWRSRSIQLKVEKRGYIQDLKMTTMRWFPGGRLRQREYLLTEHSISYEKLNKVLEGAEAYIDEGEISLEHYTWRK